MTMARQALYVVATLVVSCICVAAQTPVPALQGDRPASAPGEKPSVYRVDPALLGDAPPTGPWSPRAKTSASGAELAERWSSALAGAIARNSAAPSAVHEIELAHAYRAVGVLDQAFDHYAAATRLDRRMSAGWDGLARVWRDWGYPALGLSDAHRAVWADARSPVARRNRTMRISRSRTVSRMASPSPQRMAIRSVSCTATGWTSTPAASCSCLRNPATMT